MIYAKPSTSLTVVFRAYLASDHVTPATGKTIAITISKNGGAFGNPNAGATNATELSSGFYKVTLDTTDTGTAGPLAVRGAVATVDDVGIMYYVGQSPADVTHLLGTAWLTPGTAGTPDVNAKLIGGTAQTGRDIGASVLLSAGTGTGQLDFTSGVVKSNLAQILGTALTETAGQIAAAFKKFFDKAAPTGTINSIPDAVAGANGGLPTVDAANRIVGLQGTKHTFDDLNDLSQANIRTAVGLASANLDTQIGTLATLTKLLKYVQLLARKDAAIATDNATELTAINANGGSGAGAYDNTTDAQEALRDRGDASWTTVTAAAIRTAVGLASANLDTQIGTLATPAQVNAEVVDALNVDTYAEPGQGTPAATASLATKINYLYKNWRNKKTQTSSQWSLLNDDATTVDQKAAVADDGTTASKGEIATGP